MVPPERAEKAPDRWLDWLLGGRDFNTSELRARSLSSLEPIYHRVLDAADLSQGEVVLEVGAGEGTLGLMSLRTTGFDGRLILSDISSSVTSYLVDRVSSYPTGEIRIVQTPAESLEGIESDSVDVVLIRSVLIYSSSIADALASCARVLKPGGRLSLYEPLWSFYPSAVHEPDFFGYVLKGAETELQDLLQSYKKILPVDASPLTASGLIQFAESASFRSISASIECSSRSLEPGDMSEVTRALHGRPNPNLPSPAELALEVLGPTRAQRFESSLTQAVLQGNGRLRTAGVYLTATVT